MTTRTRVLVMAMLISLSIIGGLLGQMFDPGMGFSIGALSTYGLLSVMLIIGGKVKGLSRSKHYD